MDSVDHEILFQLQVHGRIANNELADRVGLTPSPCHRRVRLLETSGVIRRYTAILDPAAVGRGYEVLLWVTLRTVTRDTMAAVEAAFERLDEITEAYRMMGQPDYLIKVAVPDSGAFEAFYIDTLAALPEIRTLTSMTTMKTIKRNGPVRSLPVRTRRAT
ncbi:MAG: Lrp/AsnC family transcriptional regulator [Pseudonocardia sp.]